ncbi:(2Fe-2S)-binding protein [Neomegalonema perideroedes]|uniref:(2Fe-2S)-binding protein n=1 Tax=Neomegalonema perideroedes TaxID=217219 RepID=UPI000364AD38|nr:2Fe-2S iron-sulfur cluster-binding protein [Neomegalonema perideroedes]
MSVFSPSSPLSLSLVRMTVNGRPVEREAAASTTLAEYLAGALKAETPERRRAEGLEGPAVVMMNGESVKAGLVLAVSAASAQIRSYGGLARHDGVLTPLQRAFHEAGAMLCPDCAPSLVMSALDLLNRNPIPSEAEIRDWLEDSLCPVSDADRAVAAVLAAAAATRS